MSTGEEAARREFAERLCKQAADQGRLLEVGWLVMRMSVIPHDAPETQIKEMRKAYFMGADHLFASVMTLLDPGKEPTPKDLRTMDKIWKELQEFRKQVTTS